MNATLPMDKTAQSLLKAALAGRLTEKQAQQLAQRDPALVTFVLLALNERVAQLSGQAGSASPSTPSGQIPVYTKPATPRRRGRPGAREGHPGARRPPPERIDRYETHRLPGCPDCGGRLQRCNRTRRRVIEDIPEDVRVEATQHTIHRDYCPRCKKHVEPIVPDAMPKAMLGHRAVATTAWLHYGLGVTIQQVVDVLSHHLHTRLTPGGLVAAYQRLATLLEAWYRQIAQEA